VTIHGHAFVALCVSNDVDVVPSGGGQLVHADHDPLHNGFFGLAHPDPGVVDFFVLLVVSLLIAHLTLQVGALVLCIRTEAVPIGPQGVRIEVHLDDPMGHCQCDLIVGGSGFPVDD